MNKQDKKELRQQIACEWLEQNYLQYDSLRHDMVTDCLQIRNLESLEDAASGYSLEFRGNDTWRNLTDKDINTMVCQCVQETGVNISVTEIWTALKSDLITSVHPIRDWLDQLPEYTPDQPDWIDIVAQQVRVRDSAQDIGRGNAAMGRSQSELWDGTECLLDNETHSEASYSSQSGRPIGGTPSNSPNGASSGSNADALWRACFKKWFVAMVASWMNDEVVNHTVLVLVGRQGIFKTTWLDHLMPPELRAYSSKLPLSGQISKDDRLRLCENAMLNIDELDAICGREMNIVKSLLTSTDVNERAAYGRLKERRMRLASFCASTNNREFLTDITGNRRWLPFEVESIQNPFHTTLPYEYLYAQAKHLVEQGWFAYWFDMQEIEELEKHNEEFRAQDNEEQLLPILFDIPAEGKGEFMTTAEISERLVTFGGIKKPMNTRQLGMLMTKKGFEKKQVYLSGSTVRGWMVYKRDTDEITLAKKIDNNYASCQPSDIY
ncbi:MAG: hypothetical protein IKB40_07435 [Paludibacteraceae bacterium]|nr:hypothetical protein [Paludibacteraceae bacterium]